MKKMLYRLFIAGLLCMPALPTLAAPMPQAAQAQPTLYKQLGGYDAISAVTQDFLDRLAKDPLLGKFFVGHNTESLQRIRQHIVDFLCNATGGPCLYTGRDMKTAHTGLHITDAEWNAAAQDLVQTLDKFKVPEQQKTEVLNSITALKSQIVGQ